MVLETERLVLRNIKPADCSDYLGIVNSYFVQRYNCMEQTTQETLMASIKKDESNDARLVIADKATDQFIGEINLEEDSLRYNVNSIMISYWLGETFSRQGYMTEALTALIDYLFRQKGYDSITSRVFAPNIGSIRLLERLGFAEEGRLRRAVKAYGGVIYDDVLFSLQRPGLYNKE